MARVSLIVSGADDVLEGEHLPDTGPKASPEVRLAAAVILQAWQDAFILSDWAVTAGMPKTSDTDAETYRAEAIRFLTVNFGPWREGRQFWCDCAGVPEAAVRFAAKKRLKLARGNEEEHQEAAVIALDTLFAQLVECADALEPEALDAALTKLARMESAAA